MENKYYEFKNETDASMWINENYHEFLKKNQKSMDINGTLGCSLYAYTGSMSADYNNILRSTNGTIKNIDEAIDKNFYRENVCDLEKEILKVFAEDAKVNIRLIYNSFRLNAINDNIILFHYFDIKRYGKNMLKDKIFQINNFISTTMVRKSIGIEKLIHERHYNSILVIKVKKGTSCIPIWNNPQSLLKEYEIILQPKSKFKIIKVRKIIFSKIKYVIECELF